MGLLDVLQSASNSVADTVAGPVDILSLLLRKGGVPIPDEPVGGSEWMKRKGLMRDVPMGAERIAGETLGLLAPTAIAAKAPQIARGLLKAQENALAPRTLSPEAGVIVYQGSPHKYDAEKLVKLKDGNLAYVGGKFNALKEVPPGATVVDDFPLGRIRSEAIGTGEGAQMYGHGSYLAESPRVAEHYAKVLPSRVDTPEFWAGKLLPKALNAKEFAEFGELGRKMQKSGTLPAQEMARWRELNEIRSAFDAAIEAQRPSSNLYKADLPDEWLPKMLDWDKPLSQQADSIRNVLGFKVVKETEPSDSKWLLELNGNVINGYRTKKEALESAAESTGGQFLNTLSVNPSAKRASEYLRSLGVPGVKYLDGGSRGAGQGAYNYVVFPGLEDQIKILERNGVPLGLLGR